MSRTATAKADPGDEGALSPGEEATAFHQDDDSQDTARARIFSAREISDVVTRGAREGLALARQNQILETLRQAASQLVVHRPLDEVFELLLDLLFSAVPAERAAILLLEGPGRTPVIKASRSRAGRPIRSVSLSIARRVLGDGVALLLPNALEDPNFSDADSVVFSQVRSALCTPLWTEDGDRETVLGLIYLDTCRLTDAFDEDDLGLVTSLANVAAAKIQNARLLEDRVERRRLEADMRLAAQVQASLLPAEAPPLHGYSLAGSNRPCHAIGGDYFDWELGAEGLRLTLADVAGKGASAALLMTALRATVRSQWHAASLGSAARRINTSVCENVPPGRYATAFLARLQPDSGRLDYVTAGHNPPLLVRADGAVESLAQGGLAFGLFSWASYATGTVTLQRGDTLVAYSDGISETVSPRGEEFGPRRIADLVRRSRAFDAAGIELALRLELDAFAEGARADDDRTVIVLQRSA